MGIAYIHSSKGGGQNNHAGAAVLDVNSDGWPDLIFARQGQRPLLYVNQGGGAFVEEGNVRGLAGAVDAASFAAGDFDNDGDQDLFIAPHRGNRFWLYINDGTGRFTEQAVARGSDLTTTLHPHHGYSVGLVDYDLDGYFDLYVSEWGVAQSAEDALHSVLLRNRGEAAPGHFENVTIQAGLKQPISGGLHHGFSSAWADFDGDGWPDLYMVVDYGKSKMYWNNGNGTFTETTLASGMGLDENGMGIALADYDGDGLLDLYVTSVYDQYSIDKQGRMRGSKLYRNLGNRLFEEVASQAGVHRGGWGWGAAFFDYDNDGNSDLVATNGINLTEGADPSTTPWVAASYDPTTLWINQGDGRFSNATAASGIADTQYGKALLVLDWDKDGDEDLVVVNTFSPPIFYRSDASTNGNSWIRFSFEGTVSNRDGIGAVVRLKAGGRRQTLLFNPTNAYLGQREGYLHFGLGAAEAIESIEVLWPSGIVQMLDGLPVNQIHHLIEPDNAPTPPRIVEQPMEGGIFPIYGSLSLRVKATGDPAPVIVWEKDGRPVAGATSAELVIARLSPLDAGSYRARAISAGGESVSRSVDVEVGIDLESRSVARWWNEFLTDAVRRDFPYPPFVARNYFHVSAAMWDAFWAYSVDEAARAHPVALTEWPSTTEWQGDRILAQRTAICHATYTVLKSRYGNAFGAEHSLAEFRWLMEQYGLDPENVQTTGIDPVAVGNRIGSAVLEMAVNDYSGEAMGFPDTTGYQPANEPLLYGARGTTMADPNRWQPLNLLSSVTKNGIVIGEEIQQFLSPAWGGVEPFSFERVAYPDILIDPGPPPRFGGDTHDQLVAELVEVIRYSSWLDPFSGENIDVSPGVYLNNRYKTRVSRGRLGNPVTGQPYASNIVARGDFLRLVAEYWSDGPGIEGPPGVWNMLLNEVGDHPQFARRFAGVGPELSRLEWDVHAYLALNGGLHDAAIATWGIKRKYDSARPISLIRHLGALGQSSEPIGPSYHPQGLPLEIGLIEVVTAESSAEGQRHEHLAAHLGAVTVRAWRGHAIDGGRSPKRVGWILAEDWTPYHLDTFPTPNFAGYVSGHSVFSRVGAEILTLLTGSPFFPGGERELVFSQNSYLRVEEGPSQDISMSCATYYDAADITGLARLLCGVHISSDDLPARAVASQIGASAFTKILSMRRGSAEPSFPTAVAAEFGLESGSNASWARFDFEGEHPVPMRFEIGDVKVQQVADPAIQTVISGAGRAGDEVVVSRYRGPPLRESEVRGPLGKGKELALQFELQKEAPALVIARAKVSTLTDASLLLLRNNGLGWDVVAEQGPWSEGDLASAVVAMAERVGSPLASVPREEELASIFSLGAGSYQLLLASESPTAGEATLRFQFVTE